VSLADLGLHLVALLVYPGLAASVLFGALAETAFAFVRGPGGLREVVAATLVRLRLTVTAAGAAELAAALLAVLASAQLAAPFNPVSPLERNLLVAAVALIAAAWLAWARGWRASGPAPALVTQACWLVALVGPALVSQTLRPQALGAMAVPAQLPLKVGSAVLYLVCLPGVLQLLPDLAPGAGPEREAQPAGGRLLLWLPMCGLFASLFLPPAPADVLGTVRFLAVCGAAAAAAIGLGAGLAGRAVPAGHYLRVAVPLAGLVLATAAVTSVIS